MTDLEVRQQIAAFIDGAVDAAELEDSLEDAAWELEHEPARTLSATALRLLAEYSNGDWTHDELESQLGALSRTYWFEQASKTALAGSTSTLIRHDHRSPTTGRLRVAGSS